VSGNTKEGHEAWWGGGDQVTKGGRGAGGAGCRVSNGLFHKTYRREGLCWHTAFFFRRRRDRLRRSRRFGHAGPPSGPPAVRVAAAGRTAAGRTAAGRTAAGRLPRPIGPGGGRGGEKNSRFYTETTSSSFLSTGEKKRARGQIKQVSYKFKKIILSMARL
jgi:hypothetical protein